MLPGSPIFLKLSKIIIDSKIPPEITPFVMEGLETETLEEFYKALFGLDYEFSSDLYRGVDFQKQRTGFLIKQMILDLQLAIHEEMTSQKF